jgi:hypothetical protein
VYTSKESSFPLWLEVMRSSSQGVAVLPLMVRVPACASHLTLSIIGSARVSLSSPSCGV